MKIQTHNNASGYFLSNKSFDVGYGIWSSSWLGMKVKGAVGTKKEKNMAYFVFSTFGSIDLLSDGKERP